MRVIIEASDLPGRRCHPDASGREYDDIAVGVSTKASKRTGVEPVPGRPWGVTSVVPGDAESATWDLDVEVRRRDGSLDFGGPFVRGKAGDRHIGLFWGEVGSGSFLIFRGAKLSLDRVDPALIAEADRPGRALVGRLGLTDAKGNPRCATVGSDLIWTAEPPPD